MNIYRVNIFLFDNPWASQKLIHNELSSCNGIVFLAKQFYRRLFYNGSLRRKCFWGCLLQYHGWVACVPLIPAFRSS